MMDDMMEYEQQLWADGYIRVAGIDEVGRGCLFGDVVAAAVILPHRGKFTEMQDSKALTEKRRVELYEVIRKEAIAIGIGYVDASTIDQINIKQAARLAMKRAVADLDMAPDYLLVDAEQIETETPQMSLIQGDARSQSIAAASIIAKVTRDRLCTEWDKQYPEYGIAKHKGYATKQHREILREFGATPLHRKTFLSNIFTVQQELF